VISLVCRACFESGRDADVLVRAKEDGTLVYLDAQSVHGGRFALLGALVVEIVPDGEVLVPGDGRAHEAQVSGLQRYQSHLLRHELPSKRPPSQAVTRSTGARKRTARGLGGE
jgi:hypothetical protein